MLGEQEFRTDPTPSWRLLPGKVIAQMVKQIVAGHISVDDARVLAMDSPQKRGLVVVDDFETDLIGS
jgi:hypothetical protein